MQTINVANNRQLKKKDWINNKPFRAEPPTPAQLRRATARLCEREALKEKRAKELRARILAAGAHVLSSMLSRNLKRK